jgi:Uma2 family endonuclease
MTVVKLDPPRLTYSDLADTADGDAAELVGGEVFGVPRPSPLHQLVVIRIVEVLQTFRRRYGGLAFCAPIELVLSDADVLRPDVLFFKRGREQLIDLRRPIRVPCDLAIEVTSPLTAKAERGRKMQLLARHGVREYWLVDPDAQAVEVLWLLIDTYALAQRAAGPDLIRSTILPGLTVTAKTLFEDVSN